MPQVIFRFWDHVGGLGFYPDDKPRLTCPQVKELGRLIRPLIADACSTTSFLFTEKDIEWLPVPFHEGTLGNEDFEFELKTFGMPERKIKVDEAGTRALKKEILDAFSAMNIDINPKKPLLWVLWVDPDGPHV